MAMLLGMSPMAVARRAARTSGFVDDVMFAHNSKGCRRRDKGGTLRA